MGERIREGLKHGAMWGGAVVCVILICAASAAGSTVRLRGSAVVEGSGPILLRDVAALDGADEGLSGVVLVEDGAGARGDASWIVIEMDDVREALERAGLRPGRVALTGSRCVVRFSAAGRVEEEGEKAEERVAPRRPEVVDLTGPPTVRTRVVEMLARRLGVDEATSLRVLFDESDSELLAMEEWGRRLIIRPTTSGVGSRMLVEVRVISGEEIVSSRTLGVDVEVLRRVVVMSADAERGDRIGIGMAREVEMWVSPRGGVGPSGLGEVLGQRARRPVSAGQIVRGNDLEAAIMVERGSLVTVLCLKGGIGVQARGRAMRDGREGEVIECRLVDSRKSFEARVDGPGRVVMVLD